MYHIHEVARNLRLSARFARSAAARAASVAEKEAQGADNTARSAQVKALDYTRARESAAIMADRAKRAAQLATSSSDHAERANEVAYQATQLSERVKADQESASGTALARLARDLERAGLSDLLGKQEQEQEPQQAPLRERFPRLLGLNTGDFLRRYAERVQMAGKETLKAEATDADKDWCILLADDLSTRVQQYYRM